MPAIMDKESVGRVGAYFDRIGKHLPRIEQRESFATYAFGILGDGERKSVEPIAARATADAEEVSRAHDRLLHVIRESPWDDHRVRREAARYVIEALEKRERVTTWVIDDTGFLKQGRHSPGVQRQYTGSAGKIANCQLGVSLTIATETEQVPIDFRLYPPESWTADAKRRKRARVPEEITFKSKVDLALDMISSAVDDGIPGDVVLADAFFGRSADFRNTVEVLGLDYAVAIDGDRRVWLVDAAGNNRGDDLRADDLGKRAERGAFRRVTWREGTRRKMSSRFLFRRVRVRSAFCSSMFPLAECLPSIASSAGEPASFSDFAGTTHSSDFSVSFIVSLRPWPFRRVPRRCHRHERSRRSPGSRADRFRTCSGSSTAQDHTAPRACGSVCVAFRLG